MRTNSLLSRLNVKSRMPLANAPRMMSTIACGVADGGLVDVEDVADAGGEQMMVRGTRGDVVEHAGLVADRDAGAGGDMVVEVDAALAVEVAAPTAAFAVRHRTVGDELGDTLDERTARASAAASWP